jgi:hypothetical protein
MTSMFPVGSLFGVHRQRSWLVLPRITTLGPRPGRGRELFRLAGAFRLLFNRTNTQTLPPYFSASCCLPVAIVSNVVMVLCIMTSTFVFSEMGFAADTTYTYCIGNECSLRCWEPPRCSVPVADKIWWCDHASQDIPLGQQLCRSGGYQLYKVKRTRAPINMGKCGVQFGLMLCARKVTSDMQCSPHEQRLGCWTGKP